MSWTEDRIDRLKRMWEAGSTASEIAETMGGLSRNAVMGKAHRLGLSKRPDAVLSTRQRFEMLIDLIADAPVNRPLTLWQAAREVGLDYRVADSMWSALCVSKGRPGTTPGDEYRPL